MSDALSVFKLSVQSVRQAPTAATQNTRCIISELLWQIIPHR